MRKALRRTLPKGRFVDVSDARSAAMRAVKSKGNRATEVRFRMALVKSGIRGWVLHPSGVPGNPDVYLARERVAVFLDGCFWHGCPECGHIPKTRRDFWKAKIEGNRDRDRRAERELLSVGVTVLRFWEHQLRFSLGACISELRDVLNQRRSQR